MDESTVLLMTNILIATKDVLLGAIGGVVAYLLDYSKAKREGDNSFTFMMGSMLVNMALGAFVAYIIGSMLDSAFQFRDAIIGLSGVTAYNLLLLAESKFAEVLIERILSKKGT